MKIILLWLLPFFAVLQYVTGNAPLPWAEKPVQESVEAADETAGTPETETTPDPAIADEDDARTEHTPERLGFETGNIGSGERARICADEDGNVYFGDGLGPGLWKRTPDGTCVKLNDDNIRLLNELDGWLYYAAVDKGAESLVRVRTDGSEREVLAEHIEIDHLIAAESGLYYEAYDLNVPTVIVRLPLDGGEEIPLWENSPERGWGIICAYWDRTLYVGSLDALYAVSVPDGKIEKVLDEGVAYAAADEEGLFIVRLEDRQSRFIDRKTGEETTGRQLWVTFHYAHGYLYRYDYAPGNTRIVLKKVDVRTGEEETILQLSDRLFTPDGGGLRHGTVPEPGRNAHPAHGMDRLRLHRRRTDRVSRKAARGGREEGIRELLFCHRPGRRPGVLGLISPDNTEKSGKSYRPAAFAFDLGFLYCSHPKKTN